MQQGAMCQNCEASKLEALNEKITSVEIQVQQSAQI